MRSWTLDPGHRLPVSSFALRLRLHSLAAFLGSVHEFSPRRPRRQVEVDAESICFVGQAL